MALILNSRIGMIFLKDVDIKPGLPRLATRPNVENNGAMLNYNRTLAIPFLDDINFLLSEHWKTEIMWRHLLFYHLKCFIRVIALRKQLNLHTPNIKVRWQTMDATFIDGTTFGKIESSINKINQIASLKRWNLLI